MTTLIKAKLNKTDNQEYIDKLRMTIIFFSCKNLFGESHILGSDRQTERQNKIKVDVRLLVRKLFTIKVSNLS